MAGVCDEQRECPKCGKNSGVYILHTRSNEEVFSCLQCNWGYEIKGRLFAQDTLHQLSKLVCGKPLSEAGPQIERILAVLLSECKAHGRDQGPNEVMKLEDLLKRSASHWQDSDWAHIRDLSKCVSLYELENGQIALDYIEHPPEIVQVPFSALQPMAELPDLQLELKHGEIT